MAAKLYQHALIFSQLYANNANLYVKSRVVYV
jgi:hypothetical protein